jgi:hypothetical protein
MDREILRVWVTCYYLVVAHAGFAPRHIKQWFHVQNRTFVLFAAKPF